MYSKKQRLSQWFDQLFSPTTDYYALNHQIKKTAKKRASLLLVLDRPDIPLHNNPAELDIREKVIQRKIRNCFRSIRGAKASGTFLSLLATCRKLGISYWGYISDPSLPFWENSTVSRNYFSNRSSSNPSTRVCCCRCMTETTPGRHLRRRPHPGPTAASYWVIRLYLCKLFILLENN